MKVKKTILTSIVLFSILSMFVSAATWDRSDFNDDGIINGVDFVMLKSASQFDLNGDGVVDYNDLASPDRVQYIKCIKGFFAVGDCVKSDFNGDGFITPLDNGVLLSAIDKYDLNDDGKVVLRFGAKDSDLKVFIKDWRDSTR